MFSKRPCRACMALLAVGMPLAVYVMIFTSSLCEQRAVQTLDSARSNVMDILEADTVRLPQPLDIPGPTEPPPATVKAEQVERFYQVSNEQLYLYSGFVDVRLVTPVLRLFGLRTPDVRGNITCRFPGSHAVSPQTNAYPIYPSWPSAQLRHLAYVVECGVPPDVLERAGDGAVVDVAVSLGAGGAETNMQVDVMGAVAYQQRQTLAICVKAIWGPVNPVKLIEWIEFNKYLGVEKIVFYDVLTLGRAREVLAHYERQGLVDIITFSYTRKMAIVSQDDPAQRQLKDDSMAMEQTFLVSLNDCYYRYRDRFQYVLVLDIDEILVPAMNQSLIDVIKDAIIFRPQAVGYFFETAWHHDEYGVHTNSTPSYLHMQRYLRRSTVMKSQPKSIISTDRSLMINWHGSALDLTHSNKGIYYLSPRTFGFIHHYRKVCKLGKDVCSKMEKSMEVDTTMPKYKESMGELVRTAIASVLGG